MTAAVWAFGALLVAATVAMWVLAAVYVPERPTCPCTDCEATR